MSEWKLDALAAKMVQYCYLLEVGQRGMGCRELRCACITGTALVSQGRCSAATCWRWGREGGKGPVCSCMLFSSVGWHAGPKGSRSTATSLRWLDQWEGRPTEGNRGVEHR